MLLATSPLRPAAGKGRIADEGVDAVLSNENRERVSVSSNPVGLSPGRTQEEAPKMQLDERRNMGRGFSIRPCLIDLPHGFIDMAQSEQRQSIEVTGGDPHVLPEAVSKIAMRRAVVETERLLEMPMRADEVADVPACGAEDAVSDASFRQAWRNLDLAQKETRHLLRRFDLASGISADPQAIIGGEALCRVLHPAGEFARAGEGHIRLGGGMSVSQSNA